MNNDPALEEFRRRLDAAERDLHEARRWLAQHEQARARTGVQSPPAPARGPQSQGTRVPQGPRNPQVPQGPQAMRGPQPQQRPQQGIPPRQAQQQPLPQTVPQQPHPQPARQPQQAVPQRQPQSPQRQPVPQWQQQPSQPGKSPVDREKTLIGVVAIAGTVITLVGIAFLVGMAIQAGLLGPIGRVVLAYAVALALGGAAWTFREKAPQAGVTALLTTSLYAAFVTTVLVVTWLNWWPAWLGAIVMTMIFAAYMAYTHWVPTGLHRLTHMWFVVGMSLTAAALLAFGGASAAPVLFMPLLALVYAVWREDHTARAFVALGLLVIVVGMELSDPSPIVSMLTAGLSLFFLVAVEAHFPTRKGSFERIITSYVVPCLLLFWCLPHGTSEPALWIFVVIIAASIAVAWGRIHGWIALGGFPILYAFAATATQFNYFVGLADPDETRLWIYTGLVALYCCAIVALLPYLRHVVLQITWGLGIVMLAYGPLYCAVLWALGYGENPRIGLEAGFLGVALIAAWLRRGKIHGIGTNNVHAGFAAVFALVLSMVSIVGVFSGVGLVASGGDIEMLESAWYAGHAVVSVAWMALAAWLLIRHQERFTALGILLAIVSTLKLTFFDLAALPGIFRALAFLLSGIVLLMIAVRRVRFRSEANSTPDSNLHEARSAAHQ